MEAGVSGPVASFGVQMSLVAVSARPWGREEALVLDVDFAGRLILLPIILPATDVLRAAVLGVRAVLQAHT